MSKQPLSLLDVLDAVRWHKQQIDELLVRLEYVTGQRASPLIPPARSRAKVSAAARKVAAAEELVAALGGGRVNGRAPRKRGRPRKDAPPRTRGRPRTNPPPRSPGPSIAARILDDLARHADASVSDLVDRFLAAGWRRPSGPPSTAVASELYRLQRSGRITRDGESGAYRYRLTNDGRELVQAASPQESATPEPQTREE